MIVDSIKHGSLYYSLGTRIEKALKYLEQTDFSKLEPGRYDIAGDEIYAMIQDYEPLSQEQKRWEAHRRYIDVQFIASGAEMMGYAGIESLRVTEDYDESKDITWLEGEGSFIKARAGTFVILYPHDAHMPGTSDGAPGQVRKVVVKILTRTAS